MIHEAASLTIILYMCVKRCAWSVVHALFTSFIFIFNNNVSVLGLCSFDVAPPMLAHVYNLTSLIRTDYLDNV